MISAKVLPLFLGLFVVATQAQPNKIEYNVIGLLNDTHTMAVMVDNVTYPLSFDQDRTQILHTGKAPVASHGYQYLKINKTSNVTEVEPFLRQPIDKDSVNEFFNRTWNKQSVSEFPIVYEPLKAIHRVKSDLHREGEIPTIHLVANQVDMDKMHNSSSLEDPKVMSKMTYITLNETLSFNEAEISLSGRSSRWMPKLSYNIKLKKKDRLAKFRRLKLRALDTDPSYIREQLAYDVVKSTGLISSEFSFVRVFLNNQELGLFGIIETFKNPWLANSFAKGDKKYKNGYLYQGKFQTAASSAMGHISDLSYHDNITAYADGQYKVKVEADGEEKENYKPLMEFTKFIDTAPTTSGEDSVKAWKKKFDTDSFLRSMALEFLLGYADGYTTMADNYYLYQNLETDTFFYIPSDMDLTFGSTMFKLDDMWSGNYSTYPGMGTRPLMNKMMQVSEFKQTYEGLLLNLTQQIVNPKVMNRRIDQITQLIEQDVAWDSQLPRVGKDIMGEMGSAESAPTSSMEDIMSQLGNTLPPNMDMNVMADFAKRIGANVPFQVAVDGPTGFQSLSGVKEWVQNQSNAILKFYNTTQ
ncbi:coth protein-domain-containing protein [Thamnidium elegans]|nr:coth protein-domain-containing protein [Thamnidium elegans]